MALSMNRDSSSKQIDNSKYVRYTPEQVEALERVYMECPKPSSLKRQQLIRECPILCNIEPKQIKVWFQNRRCREKQRKEASRLQSVNRKLNAMNKLLTEENDRLQKQVSHLVYENGYMKQQLHTSGLESIGIVTVSHSVIGVAARACSLVSLEPTKVAEILKDRNSWYRDCRCLEIASVVPTANGGTIELIYMQTNAPTIMASARDFWTMRYTTSLEDGSIVVIDWSPLR